MTASIAKAASEGMRAPTATPPDATRAGQSDRPLTIRVETDMDFAKTAALACEGFGALPGSFTPDRMRWLYEQAFSNGTTVLGVHAGDRKVGQVALVHQRVSVAGRLESAIALVDLFILKEFRSRQAIADLYGEVERFCRETSVRFILAVPNANGARVNVRYLGLKTFLALDVRVGLCRPWRGAGVGVSAPLDRLGRDAAIALFSQFLPSDVTGLFWTPETLWARFENAERHYGVHASDNLLLISAPKTSRGLPHTLICALLGKPGATVSRREVRRLARAACALHRRACFIYVGTNHDVPLPGVSVPERFRGSGMMVQNRDFAAPEHPVGFARFELLDFDFA